MRFGGGYRAVGQRDGENVTWVWVGTWQEFAGIFQPGNFPARVKSCPTCRRDSRPGQGGASYQRSLAFGLQGRCLATPAPRRAGADKRRPYERSKAWESWYQPAARILSVGRRGLKHRATFRTIAWEAS